MKKLILSSLLILTSIILKAQTDSIRVKVIWVKTNQDGVRYKLKDIKTGTKYFPFCRCEKRFEEGEVLAIRKPDLIIEK